MNINRLFVFSFKNGDDDPLINVLDEYHTPLVDFNALIVNKSFFDQPVKNKKTTYEKLIEMSRNDVYTTWNLLDF